MVKKEESEADPCNSLVCVATTSRAERLPWQITNTQCSSLSPPTRSEETSTSSASSIWQITNTQCSTLSPPTALGLKKPPYQVQVYKWGCCQHWKVTMNLYFGQAELELEGLCLPEFHLRFHASFQPPRPDWSFVTMNLGRAAKIIYIFLSMERELDAG